MKIFFPWLELFSIAKGSEVIPNNLKRKKMNPIFKANIKFLDNVHSYESFYEKKLDINMSVDYSYNSKNNVICIAESALFSKECKMCLNYYCIYTFPPFLSLERLLTEKKFQSCWDLLTYDQSSIEALQTIRAVVIELSKRFSALHEFMWDILREAYFNTVKDIYSSFNGFTQRKALDSLWKALSSRLDSLIKNFSGQGTNTMNSGDSQEYEKNLLRECRTVLRQIIKHYKIVLKLRGALKRDFANYKDNVSIIKNEIKCDSFGFIYFSDDLQEFDSLKIFVSKKRFVEMKSMAVAIMEKQILFPLSANEDGVYIKFMGKRYYACKDEEKCLFIENNSCVFIDNNTFDSLVEDLIKLQEVFRKKFKSNVSDMLFGWMVHECRELNWKITKKYDKNRNMSEDYKALRIALLKFV